MTWYELMAILIAAGSLVVAIIALIVSFKANRLQLESAERKKNEFRLNEIRSELRNLNLKVSLLYGPFSRESIDQNKLRELESQIQKLKKEETELEKKLQ